MSKPEKAGLMLWMCFYPWFMLQVLSGDLGWPTWVLAGFCIIAAALFLIPEQQIQVNIQDRRQ